jgi:hypothetical protein
MGAFDYSTSLEKDDLRQSYAPSGGAVLAAELDGSIRSTIAPAAFTFSTAEAIASSIVSAWREKSMTMRPFEAPTKASSQPWS